MDSTSLYELQRTGAETQPSPMTLSQLYYHFSHDVLDPDIAQQIFLLQLMSSNVDLKKFPEFCQNSLLLLTYIMRLINSCGYSIASEICERFFARSEISICDIGSCEKMTGLHFAVTCVLPKVAEILIKIAGNDTWKLLTMTDHYGNTALHLTRYTNNIPLAKLILDAAGDKALTLLTMKNRCGTTASDLDNPEIKPIMQKYMINSKSI